MSASQQPGWYRDPHLERLDRWWDGTGWSAAVRPRPARRPAAGEAPRPAGRAPLSRDAKQALIITVVAAVVYSLWGYAGLDATAPAPALSHTVPR